MILIFVPVVAGSMSCGNLNGNHLVAISSISAVYMSVEPDYDKNQSSYHEETDTYEVKKFSSGFGMDLMDIVSSVCNFTYEVHIRKDKGWGDVIEFSNGSVAFTGFFESLLEPKGKMLQFKFHILGPDFLKMYDL